MGIGMTEANETTEFHVDEIDHVELCVPDRRVAAKWYRDVLGLKIIQEFEHWSDDPGGPLMLGTRQGSTKLALFEGEPTGSRRNVGFHLVAFRVGSDLFAQFVANLVHLNLEDERGRIVCSEMVADHEKAFSVYFCDPYGNQIELTTYDYEATKIRLERTTESPLD